MPRGELRLNLLQGLQMVAHIGQRVLDQRLRKLDELPCVRRGGGRRIMMVLMLGDGERRAAGSENSDKDGQQDAHMSSRRRRCGALRPGLRAVTGEDRAQAGADSCSCHTIHFGDMIAIMSPSIERYLKGLRARRQHFEAGESLFHRGDPVTDIHVVLSGAIHLVRYQGDGSVLILQRADPGSVLAEASLYSGTYHCDAVAFGAADTRVYAKASLKKLLANSPEFSNVWASHLARELQRARLRAEILSLRTVAERLDAWMAWNGGSAPRKGEWKLVANQIGISPEALYREIARRRVRREGASSQSMQVESGSRSLPPTERVSHRPSRG